MTPDEMVRQLEMERLGGMPRWRLTSGYRTPAVEQPVVPNLRLVARREEGVVNREQMIEHAAWLIHQACGCGTYPVPGGQSEEVCEPDPEDYAGAKAVVAAILPQVTTVEELDALPPRALLKGADGDVWQGSVYGWDCLSEDGTAGSYEPTAVIARSEPLTVVWQP